jgi:LacI family transcriptional regulator
MTATLRRTGLRLHANMRDVAEMAGVARMTVSRVLNPRESMREVSCARLEAAIGELKGRPNLLARGLAGGKSLFNRP